MHVLDAIITGIFCIEAMIKIITMGFIFNGRKSYLLQLWNLLDFSIVMLSLISLFGNSDFSFIKVLRIARILRPLRLL